MDSATVRASVKAEFKTVNGTRTRGFRNDLWSFCDATKREVPVRTVGYICIKYISVSQIYGGENEMDPSFRLGIDP